VHKRLQCTEELLNRAAPWHRQLHAGLHHIDCMALRSSRAELMTVAAGAAAATAAQGAPPNKTRAAITHTPP
jgi:hypothetical protein